MHGKRSSIGKPFQVKINQSGYIFRVILPIGITEALSIEELRFLGNSSVDLLGFELAAVAK